MPDRAPLRYARNVAHTSAMDSLVPGLRVAPLWVEYWYYGQVFYAVMGAAVGLSLGFVGVVMLAALAGSTVLRLGHRVLAALLPLALPLLFGATYLAVQVVVMGESLLSDHVRPIVTWILGLVTVQCLAFRRGFLHRGMLALLMIGLATLPFMTASYRGSGRFGLSSGVSIANPNDLSAWFGVCALYLAVTVLEASRTPIRVASGLAAVGCVFVMALTVSRGSLFALAIALMVAFRRILNRGFFAFLPLVVVGWVAYGVGLFDASADQFASRGMQESGRFLVWPLAIARFIESPFTGVGLSQVATFIPGTTVEITPHNQFIYIALSTGIVPLVFFVAYWVQLALVTVRLNQQRHEDAVFLVPLVLYVFLIGLQLNQPYMTPWSLIVLVVVSAHGFVIKARAAATAPWSRRRSASIGTSSIAAPRMRF